jgi:hypothetical protein
VPLSHPEADGESFPLAADPSAVQILLAPVQEADHGHTELANTYQKRR